MRALLLVPFAAVAASAPAAAQLLGERVEGDRKVCEYVGSYQTGDGQFLPNTVVLPLGEACPAVAPYRDPNRPIPGNAFLTGEVVSGDRRRCTYSQGGVAYERFVVPDQPCAQTPDLLDRALAERVAGRQ